MAVVGVDVILEVQGVSRSARSYAFLYAAFKRSEVTQSPVRDALDCLVPFIVPHLKQISGRQIDVSELQKFLRDTFSFEIPLYAIEQMFPTLVQSGLAEYDRRTRVHISKGGKDDFKIAKEEIETDFSSIVDRLNQYAKSFDGGFSPPSGSWGEALINFLKSKPSEEPAKVTNIKGVIMNPRDVETSIAASFIKDLNFKEPGTFEALLRVFMGVLIEEFISTISQITDTEKFRDLVVFYDTSVLMRVLGCSGVLYRTATVELTRYLQDLGIQIAFLSGNESEVSGILNAVVSAKDVGGEIFGETAAAISDGEIGISDLRLMQNSMVEQLAGKGIFPADDLEHQIMNLKQYQIDEKGFAAFLASRASRSQKPYSAQNLANDANFLAAVMRLRKGFKPRDLSDARAVFVTTNKLFANAARRFLIEERVLQPVHCPPVLHVGQMATIAWLMKDQKIDPGKAGRELLSNCYAAVRPDAEWFQNFRTAIEKVVGNLESYTSNADNNIQVQAARRIAQEESFGNAAIMRNLNAAELLQRATKSADEEKARIRNEEALKASALAEEARESARDEVTRARILSDQRRAGKFAKQTRRAIQVVAILFLIFAAAMYDKSALLGGESWLVTVFQVIFLIPITLSALDLVGASPVRRMFDRLEEFFKLKAFNFLHG